MWHISNRYKWHIYTAIIISTKVRYLEAVKAPPSLLKPQKLFLRLVKGRIARSAALSRSLDNLIKNSVRPIAIGRKNYLFCGNDDAAEDAAIIYTMMGCCKEAGADFRKWTNYFLEHIHEYDNDLSKPLDDFLPATLMERGLI